MPDADIPSHPYIGASAGCWALYGEVLAREYSNYRFARAHRLTTDSYAVQHPGEPGRREIQSVVVHLIGLHLSLERGVAGTDSTKVLQRAADSSERYHWLTPPPTLGEITVLHVHAAGDDADEHVRRVRDWAESAWTAWTPHHAQVRAWAAALDPARTSRRRP